jgi:hypothetical protein
MSQCIARILALGVVLGLRAAPACSEIILNLPPVGTQIAPFEIDAIFTPAPHDVDVPAILESKLTFADGRRLQKLVLPSGLARNSVGFQLALEGEGLLSAFYDETDLQPFDVVASLFGPENELIQTAMNGTLGYNSTGDAVYFTWNFFVPYKVVINEIGWQLSPHLLSVSQLPEIMTARVSLFSGSPFVVVPEVAGAAMASVSAMCLIPISRRRDHRPRRYSRPGTQSDRGRL